MRRTALIGGLLAGLLLSATGVGYAAWFSVNGSGNGRSVAAAVGAGSTPTVSASGSSVKVDWAASTLSGGVAVAGYQVKRYNSSDVLQTIGAGCAGTIAAVTCTETGVLNGTWKYSVTPVKGTWSGTESSKASVTVSTDTTPPTVTAAIANTITTTAGFVKPGGTYFVYANADDGAGSGVNASSVRADIGTVSSGTGCRDLSSATVACTAVPLSSTGGPFTVNNSDGTTTSYTYRSSQQTATSPLSGAKSFSVSASDNASNTGTSSGTTVTVDNVAPTLSSMQMFDNDGNGKVDQVKVTYSESLALSPVGTWTLANVPSSGSLGTVTVSNAQVTLPIREGTRAADTSVGSFTVALSATSPPTDFAGNPVPSFSPTAPSDKAAPVPTLVTLVDVQTAGIIVEKKDSLTIGFSEALSTTSMCSTGFPPSGNVTVAITDNGTNDTLTVSAAACTLNIGSVSLGGNYVTATATWGPGSGANNSSVSFSSTTLTIALGTKTSGTLNSTAQTAGTPVYTPSTSITDAASNAMTATAFSAPNTSRF
jgi:hypothetical protein